MEIWRIYAYISGGVVKNTASFLYSGAVEASLCAKRTYEDENAFAVDVTHTPVQIGDTYSDGKFYRDGAVIEALPSIAQQVEQNSADIDALIIAITPTEG